MGTSEDASRRTPPTADEDTTFGASILLGLDECEGPKLSLAEGQERFLRHLKSFLPEPPARLWLGDDGNPPSAAYFTAEGYSADLLPPPASSSKAFLDAALILSSLDLSDPAKLEVLKKDLDRLREHLKRDAPLLILDLHPVCRPEAESWQLEIDLAEAGFRLRKKEDLTPKVRWSARPLVELSPSPQESEGLPFPSQLLEKLATGQAECHLLVYHRDDFKIRGYREGDEKQILELFAGCFHQPRSRDHWRWQYLSAPNGSLRLSLAFRDDGLLAAQYAGYPARFLRFDANGKHELAAHQIGDTMTRPEMRHLGRGPTSLLCRTANHFYASSCAGQVAFNYGFNVGNIQRFSMRFLRARRVAPVAYWRRSLLSPTSPVLELSRLDRWWRGYRVQAVSKLDESWDTFFEEVGPQYEFLGDRSARYLRWRYLERPGFDYRIIAAYERRRLRAWSVFRRREATLVWGDGLFDRRHPRLVAALLAAALASPLGDQAETVEGWFAPQPAWLSNELQRIGFERHEDPQGLALMCVPFAEPDPTEEMRDKLYYTLGDSDLF